MTAHILVTGAGGAPATNFVRSLRMAPEEFRLIGTDADKYYLQRAETDPSYLVPLCTDDDYFPVMNSIIVETGAQLVFAQPDVEIAALSARRGELACNVFLPDHQTIEILQDKYASFERWRGAGITVPDTAMIHDEQDLRAAFATFGPKLWIRATAGAFGKGSLPTDSFDQAKAWLDFQQGWGRFAAAECLQPQTVTWQSIWYEGELIVAQGRKRLYWEFANRAPSGVTGLTGTGVTYGDPALDELAQAAIAAVDSRPHGIFSVDMTYDSRGVPNPTEINIGRFFTTHLFFTCAGLNMPLIYVSLALGLPLPPIKSKCNPLPNDLAWVRGMDIKPVLTDVKAIDATEQAMHARLAQLRGR